MDPNDIKLHEALSEVISHHESLEVLSRRCREFGNREMADQLHHIGMDLVRITATIGQAHDAAMRGRAAEFNAAIIGAVRGR